MAKTKVKDKEEGKAFEIRDNLGYLDAGNKPAAIDPEKLTSDQLLAQAATEFKPRENYIAVIPERVSVTHGETNIEKSAAEIKKEQEDVMMKPVIVALVPKQCKDIKVGELALISKHSVPEAMINLTNNYQLRYYNIHNIVGNK